MLVNQFTKACSKFTMNLSSVSILRLIQLISLRTVGVHVPETQDLHSSEIIQDLLVDVKRPLIVFSDWKTLTNQNYFDLLLIIEPSAEQFVSGSYFQILENN